MNDSIETLVYGDLGDAGREMLARRELGLRWAMTLEEAVAVLQKVPVRVVLTSDPFALPLMQVGRKLNRLPSCIVVLSPAAMAQRREYEALGATALVPDTNPEGITEAFSQLTGLAFRTHPRAPIATVVDVLFKGERHLLSTKDVSAGGVCVTGLDYVSYGDTVHVRFEMLDPPLEAEAMVVRSTPAPDGPRTSLCFTSISKEDRRTLQRIVDEHATSERASSEQLPQPGSHTLDLLSSLGSRRDAGLGEYRALLATRSRSMPGWLRDVDAALTPSERSALRQDRPKWALTTVNYRVEMARCLMSREPFDRRRALELCDVMAGLVCEDELVDATRARADILRLVNALSRQDRRSLRNKRKESPANSCRVASRLPRMESCRVQGL